MSHSLTNYLRKKLKLGFYGQKQPGITPFQAHNFCTIARDGDREKPKPFSQLQFTQHNTAASQPALYWLKKRDVAGLCLDATSAQHRGVFSPPIPKFPLYFPASLMLLWVPHSGQPLEPPWGSPKYNCREHIPILLSKVIRKLRRVEKVGGYK